MIAKLKFDELMGFNVKWNFRSIMLLAILLVLPNALGMLNISTVWGFKIHFFQLAVFIAGMLYGPKGGALSGLMGSFFSAILMNNPYIVVGNVILGFSAGFFFRLKFPAILSVLLAYLVQLPWLILTDYYLMNLPMVFIQKLVIALLVSNLIWGMITPLLSKSLKRLL